MDFFLAFVTMKKLQVLSENAQNEPSQKTEEIQESALWIREAF